MRIVSIDLPWSADGTFGFALTDADAGSITIEEHAGCPADAPAVFGRVRDRYGLFDVVLLDQPIDPIATGTGYRAVERAFGNSAFVAASGRRIQCPRFQPGAAHGADGWNVARLVQRTLATERGVVVEAFPQLSVPALLLFGAWKGLLDGSVVALNSHKVGVRDARARAQRQLLALLSAWTSRGVSGAAAGADGVDAALALLPALQGLAPAPRVGAPATWADAVWLHSTPPGDPPAPWRVARRHRMASRAAWMSRLSRRVIGAAGIRRDGILAMRLPGWPEPGAPERRL
jgi:hypothetical protein